MLHRLRAPSPALVVSIIALVVACTGTAFAAKTLITSSQQVKDGVLTGADIRNSSIGNADIRKADVSGSRLRNETITLNKLTASTRKALTGSAPLTGASATAATAIEAVRKQGPSHDKAASGRVVTLKGLPAGTWAIFAQTTIITPSSPEGLNELLKSDKTASALCELDAAGDVTKGRTILGTLGQDSGGTVNMQITRTLDQPGDIALNCASNYPWQAGTSSIVAVPLAKSVRLEVDG